MFLFNRNTPTANRGRSLLERQYKGYSTGATNGDVLEEGGVVDSVEVRPKKYDAAEEMDDDDDDDDDDDAPVPVPPPPFLLLVSGCLHTHVLIISNLKMSTCFNTRERKKNRTFFPFSRQGRVFSLVSSYLLEAPAMATKRTLPRKHKKKLKKN